MKALNLFDNNKITDEGIANLSNLKKIWISYSKITVNMKLKLEKKDVKLAIIFPSLHNLDDIRW